MTSGTVECAYCHAPIPPNSRYCLSCGADLSEGGGPPSRTSTATLLPRLQRLVEGTYRIERVLGKGGMGTVFLAHDLALEREVAIKVLPPDVAQDDQVVRRFQQEAKTSAKLDHPNIIPIYRVESEDGLNYFVMKYISGTSLEDVLSKKEPLEPEYIQRVLWEAASALGHAHQRGVVHRDVKPANIMFDHDGRVMLTDFGISKALQAATGFTATGMIIGTPHYMAPEQAKGHAVDGRADQYSLGVVGYRMITGDLPFAGESVHTILYKQIFEDPPPLKVRSSDVPRELLAAINRAMAKEPKDRFPTMQEFAEAVWPGHARMSGSVSGAVPRPRVTADTPTEMTSAPTTPLPQSVPRPRPKRSRAPFVVGAVVAAGVGAYVVLNPGSKPATPATAVRSATASDTSKQAASAASTDSPRAALPTPVPRIDTVRVAETVKVATPVPPRKPKVEQPAALTGFLTVSADPYGELYVDGVDVGPTPVVHYSVPAGAHAVRIVREGYRTVTDKVQVDAGNTVPKRYTLLPEG
ncbi:MAG TPA: protein kinase [Gemmatimonadales bacterium]|nr:protein kinase [Gemmatimonadales bacterium]